MGMDEEKNTPEQNIDDSAHTTEDAAPVEEADSAPDMATTDMPDADDEATDAPASEDEADVDVAVDESTVEDFESDDFVLQNNFTSDFALTDDLDIESALASVANLSALITDTTEMVQLDAPASKSDKKETTPPIFTSNYPRPPMLTLERGQLPSVIPALALMSIGAGLTFLLITGAEAVNTDLVNALAIGGVCLMLLLVWLASGRWARGALFLALSVATTAGILIALPQTQFSISQGLPLVLCGLGASVILSGLLSPKHMTHGFFMGLLLILIGAVAFVYQANILPPDFTPLITQYGAIAGAIAGVLLFIPAIFKRRR